MNKKKSQIKTRERISAYGEVFTGEKEVSAMLDLVASEANKIDSTFLEPACGNGNFLIQILERKMQTVKRKYKKVQYDYEKNLFVAVASIYGIDIQEDNVRECIERLYKYIEKEYKRLFKTTFDTEFLKSLHYVLETNIIFGNSLRYSNTYNDLILFAEWSMIESAVKRKDFVMVDMIAFSYMENKDHHIIKSTREYPTIHFKEVYKLGRQEL